MLTAMFLAAAAMPAGVRAEGIASATEKVAEKADIYVSPQGDDSWSGRLLEPSAGRTDGPLASVAQAQRLVRRLKQSEPDRKTPIVVAIRGGWYYLPQPLRFAPADSGTAQAAVIYQAYGHERPILSGGRRIEGWQVDAQGRWHASLPDVKSGAWAFAQLFVNDQRRWRPRLPKQGYFHVAEEITPSPAARDRGFDRFKFAGDDLRADWTNLGDVEVLAFHQWTASRLRIAELDAQQHVVRFTGPTSSLSNWASFPQGNRFLVENVREALGDPGQWYMDRSRGELIYIPLPGEKPESSMVIAPRLPRLVVLEGNPRARQWVQHLVFRRLTFAHDNWTLEPHGQSFPQAEVNVGGSISAVGARNITFDTCAVRHVGRYALAFGAGCRNNLVERCELVDLGGGGVLIGQVDTPGEHSWGTAPAEPEEVASHHTVRQCLIAHGGRLHSAGVGIWIGHSPHNRIEHNDIFDFYYTGISVGWVWGYSPSEAHDNDIGFNHVHTIGQHVLSDMGGIYTLGISPGTRIHDNCFHDIESFSYGGWGLYTDEGSSNIALENNVVYRTKTGGFHQHYGKDNVLRNNVFAFSTEQQLQRTRTELHTSFVFERNIVFWDNNGPLLGSNWDDNHFALEKNIYWNSSGRPVNFPGGLTLEQWQAKRGQDQGSLVADPKFVDPQKNDFRLQDDSPARKLGFKSLDASQAGRTEPLVLTQDLPAVPRAFE
jgi:parallel beta-helix repeat protein